MRVLAAFFIFSITFIRAEIYFQQDVDYDIEVTLNDTDKTLTAYEIINYKNNSPDTLEFIWFHLWPNAYKNDSSALAKQFFRLGSTRFLNTKETNRGYIDSLDFSVDGVKAEWQFHSEYIDVAKIFLPEPLFPGAQIKIETPFFVKLPRVISRLGHMGKHFEITQWYPKPAVYDKNGWHAMPYLNMGEFYSEYGTFDVKITLPENYRLMATGDMVNGQKELSWLDSLAIVGDSLKNLSKNELEEHFKKIDGKKEKLKKATEKDSLKVYKNKTIHFRQKDVHDFAWFADPNWIVQKGELSLPSSNRKVTLWSMYLPENAWTWRKSLEYLHDSGQWFSKSYGEYPYNHITAVDGNMSAGGGMEYPNITVISRSDTEDLLEYVIMHEVGHNWFYGILGTNERDHAWMDEGLTEFSGIRYWEEKYDKRNGRFIFSELLQDKIGIGKNVDMSYYQYSGYCSGATSQDAQPLNISSNENYFYRNYGKNYSKVSVMMRYLQHYLGEEKLDIIMQDYYESWKFKHPGPKDFVSFFNKHLDEDINWFFENMIDSTTYIDYKISKKNGKYFLENVGSFNAMAEVAYYDGDNQEINRIWVRPKQKQTALDVPSNCSKIIIDPDQYMPDVNRTNNSTNKKLKMNFVFDKPTFYNIDLNVSPWFPMYNSYDGLSNGIYIKYGGSAGFGGQSIDAWLLYGDRTKMLNGIVWTKKEIDNLWSFSSGIFESMIESRNGREGASFKFVGNNQKRDIYEYENKKIEIDLYYHNIKSNLALSPELYDLGEFGIAKISMKNFWERDMFNEFSIGSQLHFSSRFAKLNFRAGYYKKFSKKVETLIKINFGTFLFSDKIPKQYRYYLSGSIVPDFDNYVWDRSGDNQFSILNGFYHNGGIRGVNVENPYLASTDNILSLRIDQKVPKIPGKIFFDYATGSSLPKESYISSGIKLGPLIIPLYQNWEEKNKIPNNFEWIKERVRFIWVFSRVSFF